MIRGQFALVQRPVIVAETGLGDLSQQGVELARKGTEYVRPIAVGEVVAQVLSRRQVADLGERVLVTVARDAPLLQTPPEPLAPVEVDLDLKRKPSL